MDFSATLKEKKELCQNVYHLVLSRPEGFEYQAGQFIQTLIPDDGKLTPRSYSLCSTPPDENLELCVKFLEGGLASEHFRQMDVGESIECKGPQGRFVANPEATEHVFVATGVGMAPIMGIIWDELVNKGSTLPITLLFGVRHEDDQFWIDELDELAKKHKNFNFTLTLSQPSDAWEGARGRVTEHIPFEKNDAHWYLCGSGAMVKDVRTTLIEHEVPPKHIHFEIF